MFVLLCCSFRKADAKVEVLDITTKQFGDFFARFFVNKYNSLSVSMGPEGIGGITASR